MSHVRVITLGVSILLSLAGIAAAQSADTVIYYHTDAIGSVRMTTDANGGVLERYDFQPFGVACGSACGTGSTPETVQFGGKERDADTGFDYFTARYYDSPNGRFTSPDLITVNASRLLNPQRLNRYAYALNNPLKYFDPDGMDALLINYSDGANGFGHMGIVALRPDGSGLYGGFNPVQAGSPVDRGVVKTLEFPKGTVVFMNDRGRPSTTSLANVREQLAKFDGHGDMRNVFVRHIKTTDAETAALEAYIRRNEKAPWPYVVGDNDCLDFCVRGLAGIGFSVPASWPLPQIPNHYFNSWLLDLAVRMGEWMREPTPKVETWYCVGIQGVGC
jgi:RHS repeat-associated protein